MTTTTTSLPRKYDAAAIEREVKTQYAGPWPAVLRFHAASSPVNSSESKAFTFKEMRRVWWLFTSEVRGIPSEAWVDPIATAEIDIHGVRVLHGYVVGGYWCAFCRRSFFAATLDDFRHECHEGGTKA
jgi:hypothetical protein